MLSWQLKTYLLFAWPLSFKDIKSWTNNKYLCTLWLILKCYILLCFPECFFKKEARWCCWIPAYYLLTPFPSSPFPQRSEPLPAHSDSHYTTWWVGVHLFPGPSSVDVVQLCFFLCGSGPQKWHHSPYEFQTLQILMVTCLWNNWPLASTRATVLANTFCRSQQLSQEHNPGTITNDPPSSCSSGSCWSMGSHGLRYSQTGSGCE